MITNKGGFHIKNVKAPKKLTITLNAAINNFRTGTMQGIDILPYDYFENNIKSTGDVIKDLKNYISDVVDKVTKACFYDINKKEECDRYIRTLGKKIDERTLELITVPALNRLNLDFIESIDINDNFTIFIRKVEEDLEMFGGGDFNSIAKFISLFKCNEHLRDYYQIKNEILTLNEDHFCLTLTLKEFINCLIRIFFYCLSQSYRDYITASVMYFVNIFMKTQYDNVLCWDNKINKYFGIKSITEYKYFGQSNSDKTDFSFWINDISPTTSFSARLENHYEFTNQSDKLKYDYKEPTVYITKPGEILRCTNLCDNVFSYVAYLPYTEKSVNKVASIQLTATLDDFNIITNLNEILYSKNPYYKFYSLNKCLKIRYDELYMDKSIKELMDKNMLDFYCSVCYYNDTRKTVIGKKDLKEKNIPKFKRDIIYKAFCHLCYELDLNPITIQNYLDVSFKKYYKEPIGL